MSDKGTHGHGHPQHGQKDHGHKPHHEKPAEQSAAVNVTGNEDAAMLERLLTDAQSGALAGDANAIAAMDAIKNALITFGQQQEAAKLAAASAATQTAQTGASAEVITTQPGQAPVAISASMQEGPNQASVAVGTSVRTADKQLLIDQFNKLKPAAAGERTI